jgi:hypothetical protein
MILIANTNQRPSSLSLEGLSPIAWLARSLRVGYAGTVEAIPTPSSNSAGGPSRR